MKIYDISQEVFTCDVFPGDVSPSRHIFNKIDDGDIYNLTGITMCAHNGTHVDAPYHFYKDGNTIDEIELSKFVGKCYVVFREGALSKSMAEEIIEEARKSDVESSKRILIGGDMFVTLEAAKVFSENNIYLLGNELQTVGPIDEPAAVHYELLKSEVVLLEGIRLKNIKEGVYMLNAAPINLGGADGAPCRAILIGMNDVGVV